MVEIGASDIILAVNKQNPFMKRVYYQLFVIVIAQIGVIFAILIWFPKMCV
jgi:hypothetical protein